MSENAQDFPPPWRIRHMLFGILVYAAIFAAVSGLIWIFTICGLLGKTVFIIVTIAVAAVSYTVYQLYCFLFPDDDEEED